MTVSRLFNIEPIGIGTPYVESLPSYIKRLAEAHSVYPGVLLKHEIFPETRYYNVKDNISNYKKILYSISSKITNDLIRVLEVKTNNYNIHNMSLSKLNGYINSMYIFRDHAAWCPLCYEESRQKNKPVYEQLIWSINDIEFCGKHGVHLYSICPQCHKQIKHYNPLGRVGYCYHCKSWLGLNKLDGNSYKELNKWDIWKLDNIGSILSDIPKFNLSAEACLSKNLIEILNFTGFSWRDLGKEIAVTNKSTRNWATKDIKPTLSSILLLGYRFGLSVNKLLFEEVKSKCININGIKEVSNSRRSTVDFNELQQSLKEALTSTELISINGLAKKYGVKRDTVKRHFPRECDLLKHKYMRQKEEKALKWEAQIRDAMISLNKKGIFPNVNRVERELGKHVLASERYHIIWESTLLELGYTDKKDSV